MTSTLLNMMPPEIAKNCAAYNTSDFDMDKFRQKQLDRLNNTYKKPTYGIDCPVCKNKEVICYNNENGISVSVDCKCKAVRKAKKLIADSGLTSDIERCTFDSFEHSKSFQDAMFNAAKYYAENSEPLIYFVGGQSGSGKTHICTAIVRELLCNKLIPVRYMSWYDESVRIKSLITDNAAYREALDSCKNTEGVLYIDDFLKKGQNVPPTSSDMGLAFEIINYRCQRSHRTIISTERTLTEIIGLDSAVGGRIKEYSANCCINIEPDKNKNYRLKSMY